MPESLRTGAVLPFERFVSQYPVVPFVPDPTLKNGGVPLGGSMTGTVRWFKEKKGYGRITGDDGYVYWFHFSSIETEGGPRSLTEGQPVTFSWHGTRADFDRKAAEHVRPL